MNQLKQLINTQNTHEKVREWAEHHAREVEALEKRPHDALAFVRAIDEGSRHVLGAAAELMSVHSPELAAAETVAAVVTLTAERSGGMPDHWKPWKPDGLDALKKTLGESLLGRGRCVWECGIEFRPGKKKCVVGTTLGKYLLASSWSLFSQDGGKRGAYEGFLGEWDHFVWQVRRREGRQR